KQGTIDVVGRDSTRDCVVCLTNWDAPEMEYARYEQLLSDLQTARLRTKQIYLFSAKAFAKELVQLEKENESVVRVDMTEL
ncbi:MAG: ATP-binding protein, partial [Lachnospiraceae bacterium]|nr:ATP-binding protein [Lachnospiraceae bacterium]